MEGADPRSRDNCRSRWFAPTSLLPYWDDSGKFAPRALHNLCMDRLQGHQKDVSRRNYFDAIHFQLTVENDLYLGPSFTDLNCLTDVERIRVARANPIVQVYSARTG